MSPRANSTRMTRSGGHEAPRSGWGRCGSDEPHPATPAPGPAPDAMAPGREPVSTCNHANIAALSYRAPDPAWITRAARSGSSVAPRPPAETSPLLRASQYRADGTSMNFASRRVSTGIREKTGIPCKSLMFRKGPPDFAFEIPGFAAGLIPQSIPRPTKAGARPVVEADVRKGRDVRKVVADARVGDASRSSRGERTTRNRGRPGDRDADHVLVDEVPGTP